MKKQILLLFLSLVTINAHSQSETNASEKLDRAVTEVELMTNYFINQITNSSKKAADPGNEIIYPYARSSDALSLVDEYHLLMLSLVNDFSVEDLTSRNYLKKLQENSAVKSFQSELYDQIKSLKEDFQKDTEEALEGIGKE